MITKLDTAAAAIEPLPDPPERNDIRQNLIQVPAQSSLQAYYGGRTDVLVRERDT